MLKSREVPISQLRKTELAIGRAVDFNYGKAVFNLFRCSDSLYCYLVGTVIPKYRSLGWTFEYRAGDFRDSLRRLVEMLYMNVSKFAPIERVLLSCALLVASVMWTCKSRLVPVSVVSWLARETSFGESIIVKHANAVILQACGHGSKGMLLQHSHDEELSTPPPGGSIEQEKC